MISTDDTITPSLRLSVLPTHAGYDTKNPAVIAAKELTKVKVRERIKRRIDQAGISAQEVLGGLAEISRFDITDLLNPDGHFDLDYIRAMNLGGCVKSVTIRREAGAFGAAPAEVIRFEVYSKLEALQTLAKIHRLEQGTNLTLNLGGDDERQVNFLVTLVKQLHAQAGKEGDPITIEGVLDKCIECEKTYQDKDLRSLKPIIMKRLSDGSFGVGEQEKDDDGGSNAVEG